MNISQKLCPEAIVNVVPYKNLEHTLHTLCTEAVTTSLIPIDAILPEI